MGQRRLHAPCRPPYRRYDWMTWERCIKVVFNGFELKKNEAQQGAERKKHVKAPHWLRCMFVIIAATQPIEVASHYWHSKSRLLRLMYAQNHVVSLVEHAHNICCLCCVHDIILLMALRRSQDTLPTSDGNMKTQTSCGGCGGTMAPTQHQAYLQLIAFMPLLFVRCIMYKLAKCNNNKINMLLMHATSHHPTPPPHYDDVAVVETVTLLCLSPPHHFRWWRRWRWWWRRQQQV